MLQPWDIIRIFTNLQLQQPHGHLDKKRSTLVGVIAPIHHKKIDRMGYKECPRSTEDPPDKVLVLLGPV